MEQIALYKDFRIRAYQDWSGQWLAEAKRPFETNPDYIATPSPHPTPEAAVDLVKQLIDREGTEGGSQTEPSKEDNSGEAMLEALRAEFPAHVFVPRKRKWFTLAVPALRLPLSAASFIDIGYDPTGFVLISNFAADLRPDPSSK
jgi:hypothetical protein